MVAVGGPGGNLGDLTNATKSKIWLDVAVIAIALTLVLVLALRSIVLPAVAIVFNLLVVGAAFGVIQMLFGGSITRRSVARVAWIRSRSSASSRSPSASPMMFTTIAADADP